MTASALGRAPLDFIDASAVERLLSVALSRGGERAELFFEHRAWNEVRLGGASKSAVEMGLGVRVQKGDATGHAHTRDLEGDSMRRAAETAAQVASGPASAPRPLRAANLPRRYELARVTLDLPDESKRALLERAAKAAHAADPRVVEVEVSFAEELREILIVTSEGTLARDAQPLMRFGVRVIVEEKGARREGSSAGGGRTTLGYFDRRSPGQHAREAVRLALLALDAIEAPAGPTEVVLAGGEGAILIHEAIGHGLEADFLRKGASRYRDRLGERVASELCTLIDDATLLQARGSLNVDDEGHEPRASVLIEQGRLVGYLHDAASARQFGVEPTGNGRRESFARAPMPRMTNTIVTAGPHDPEEIVRSVKRGVLAKKLGAGEVDHASGDFVFAVTEGYQIEDGKITAPLRDVSLIGNGADVLRDVTMLGSDVEIADGAQTCWKDGQRVPVGVGCPTFKVSSITVGTKLG